MVSDVVRSIPKISAGLDDHKAEYQPAMVELERKITRNSIFLLIDRGARFYYISPKIVDFSQLQVVKFSNPWLVQLARRTKRRVIAKVKVCGVEIA